MHEIELRNREFCDSKRSFMNKCNERSKMQTKQKSSKKSQKMFNDFLKSKFKI